MSLMIAFLFTLIPAPRIVEAPPEPPVGAYVMQWGGCCQLVEFKADGVYVCERYHGRNWGRDIDEIIWFTEWETVYGMQISWNSMTGRGWTMTPKGPAFEVTVTLSPCEPLRMPREETE